MMPFDNHGMAMGRFLLVPDYNRRTQFARESCRDTTPHYFNIKHASLYAYAMSHCTEL